MKHIRQKLALVLCAAITAHGATALAASSDVPTFKLSVPKDGVTSGAEGTLTVNADDPGFITIRLLDASGSEVAALFEFAEVHEKENDLTYTVEDADGEDLAAGSYTLEAEMESQFGVLSKTVTASLTVNEPVETAEDEDDGESASSSSAKSSSKSSSTSDDDDSKSTSSSTSSSKTSSSSKSSSSAKSSSASSSDEMEYESGSTYIGDEDLEIGVGPSDAAEQTDAGYWGLTADASDEEIWAALTRDMYGVDVAENESAYIYDSPESGRDVLGTVSGISQGLNVIKEREDGWALVECYRNEDGAFIRGYIRSNKLRKVEPNTTYGIVIDKKAQELIVFKNGKRIGSCQVTTGLPTAKYPHRETPAGEYILVTRRGSYEYYGKGYTKYTIRINGNYYLAEIPTTKKNGKDYSLLEDSLGEKATRGTVCVAHDKSSDGGINAEWIWNMTDDNKKVKVLIFDDKDRDQVPVADN